MNEWDECLGNGEREQGARKVCGILQRPRCPPGSPALSQRLDKVLAFTAPEAGTLTPQSMGGWADGWMTDDGQMDERGWAGGRVAGETPG